MSRRQSLRTGLIVGTVSAALVIVAQLVTGAVHPAGGTHPAGSLAVDGAPGITNQLQHAGLVDGTTLNTAAVRTLLAKIPAATAASTPTYDRDAFGPAWADTDHNGCDQRNDVLARDLTAVTYKPGTHDCVVLAGTLHDPYTGQEISFTRGATTSTAVQIDHMVPLSWAWQHGASTWTQQHREQLATDLSNLTAVDGPSNESKSDQGPATWLPTASYSCTYVARFTYVVHRYDLTLDSADRTAIDRTLGTCK